jgi:hypothetical protein
VVGTVEFDQLRSGDMFGEIATHLNIDHAVVAAVEHECGDTDGS